MPFLSQVVETGFAHFIKIERTHGRHGPAHDRDLGLTEPVDALFHVANDANGRVPCTEGPLRVLWMMPPTPPQPGQQPIMRGICVLILVDNERSELAAEIAKNREAAVQVLLQRRPVIEQGKSTRNMGVSPRLIAHTVERIDDGWRITMTANIRASSQ